MDDARPRLLLVPSRKAAHVALPLRSEGPRPAVSPAVNAAVAPPHASIGTISARQVPAQLRSVFHVMLT